MSHPQYADDTLIFCDADRDQLRHLRVILVLMPSLKVFQDSASIRATILGGELGELPSVYLCMPLGAKSKSTEIWNNVTERHEKKLAMEIATFVLWVGGGLTLINSALDALPTYVISLFLQG